MQEGDALGFHEGSHEGFVRFIERPRADTRALCAAQKEAGLPELTAQPARGFDALEPQALVTLAPQVCALSPSCATGTALLVFQAQHTVGIMLRRPRLNHVTVTILHNQYKLRACNQPNVAAAPTALKHVSEL